MTSLAAPPKRAATGEPPLVTVVLCVYNGGALLRPAVDSVLAQTWPQLELLVVDDGSTDGCADSLAEIDDPRLRVIRQPNAGKPAALNRALDEARGAFYAIQDADDLSHPERIERQVARLLAEPELAGVFCGYDLILEGRHVAPRLRGKSAAECARDIAALRMPGHDPTAMYRVSAVRDLRYDPDLRIGEGLDYILRVGERAPLAVCEGALYSYRIELGSLTKQDPAKRDAYVREVVSRACVRRGIEAPSMRPRRRLRQRDRDNNLAAHFIESARDLRAAGRFVEAVRVGLRCAALWPWAGHYWKALVYALAPWRVARWLRRR